MIDPKNLPDRFCVNGVWVPYALMRRYFKKVFGRPVSGYVIECRGQDCKKYFVAARVLFETPELFSRQWQRVGWDVEFYSTKKAASRVLELGWRRVFNGGALKQEVSP